MPLENKKLKVVIDTNVFISALNFGGKPAEVLSLMADKKIEVFLSSFILKEINEVLAKKFGWEKKYVGKALNFIEKKSIIVNPKSKFSIIKGKKDDNRILDCAYFAGVDFIISGDTKHLLSLKKFKNIAIVSPVQFLQIIKRF